MTFEDLNSYDAQTSYMVPNEDLQIWRDFTKHLHVRKAAGICSAGEVGLFALLPVVRDSLTLVDHSYASLGFAMMKYLLIREVGWKRAVELIDASGKLSPYSTRYDAWGYASEFGEYDRYGRRIGKAPNVVKPPELVELEEICARLVKQLPPEVYAKSKRDYYGGELILLPKRSTSPIPKYWENVSRELIRRAAQKLDKVHFIHGDFSDLRDRGPFDLLYMSNAHGHTDRNRKSPSVESIQALVKPGGYVISTSNHKAEARGWEVLNSADTSRTTNYHWVYHLYRTPREVPQAQELQAA